MLSASKSKRSPVRSVGLSANRYPAQSKPLCDTSPMGRGRISATSHGHLALMDRAGQDVSRTYPAQLSIKTISNLWEISLFLILLNVHEIELLFLQKNLENATIVCYGWRARH